MVSEKTLEQQRKTYEHYESVLGAETISSINSDIDNGVPLKTIANKHGLNYNTFRKYAPHYKREIQNTIPDITYNPPVLPVYDIFEPKTKNTSNYLYANGSKYALIDKNKGLSLLHVYSEKTMGLLKMNCMFEEWEIDTQNMQSFSGNRHLIDSLVDIYDEYCSITPKLFKSVRISVCLTDKVLVSFPLINEQSFQPVNEFWYSTPYHTHTNTRKMIKACLEDLDRRFITYVVDAIDPNKSDKSGFWDVFDEDLNDMDFILDIFRFSVYFNYANHVIDETIVVY